MTRSSADRLEAGFKMPHRGEEPRLVRYRIRCFDNLDPVASDAEPLSRNDDPSRTVPLALQRFRHLCRTLACTDYNGAALRARRQIGGDPFCRIGSSDRRINERGREQTTLVGR